jgi:hypothetical protein
LADVQICGQIAHFPARPAKFDVVVEGDKHFFGAFEQYAANGHVHATGVSHWNHCAHRIRGDRQVAAAFKFGDSEFLLEKV